MARASFVAPLLAEVHIAHELAAYNQVKAIAQSLGLQRACVGQRRPQLGGAQVREQVQLFANAQKAALGTIGGRLNVVPFRAANSAQQHRIGRLACVDGFLRQGHAELVDGRAANETLVVVEVVAELLANLVERLQRLIDDFGANSVALQNANIEIHNSPITRSSASLNKGKRPIKKPCVQIPADNS